jgi:hypothetical protein
MGHLLWPVISSHERQAKYRHSTWQWVVRSKWFCLGHGLHSQKSCANTAYHIVNEIRKIVVKSTVLQQNKMSFTTDESTGMLRVKTLCVVNLQTGVAKTSDPVFLFWLGTCKMQH